MCVYRACVYTANQLWPTVPHEVRKSMSLAQFKSKASKPSQECDLCKQYVKKC